MPALLPSLLLVAGSRESLEIEGGLLWFVLSVAQLDISVIGPEGKDSEE